MRTITHREMRNNSAELLRQVAAGESVIISNHGHPAALISPIPRSALEDLAERGQVRAAKKPLASLATVRRRTSHLSTTDILSDLRGDR
jgi:prevent-host-death family protein